MIVVALVEEVLLAIVIDEDRGMARLRGVPRSAGAGREEGIQGEAFVVDAVGNPFFLYMPHTFPHIPLAASPRFRGKSPNGLYGDVIEEIDWSVGEIMSTLKRNGLDNNTIVMFSSDNGPWYQGSPRRLRGRKGSTYEGGVREPFLARFPGRIPKGLVSRGVSGTVDILPTLAKLCDAPLPGKPLDGIDIWPLLSGKVQQLDREALLYFDNWNLQCARWGKWKLHFARYNSFAYSPAPAEGRVNLALATPELYDLDADPDESYDVAADNPAIVSEIQGRVARLLPTFPDEVQKAWAATHKRETLPGAAGSLPEKKN